MKKGPGHPRPRPHHENKTRGESSRRGQVRYVPNLLSKRPLRNMRYNLMVMVLGRRHIADRMIALLMAAMMPLCCCAIGTASGQSCCDPIEILQAKASCCPGSCQVEPSMGSEEQPQPCSCCLKAPSTAPDWSPPVDTLGTPLTFFALGEQFKPTAGWQATGIPAGTDPPPGPCNPDQLRGQVILQV